MFIICSSCSILVPRVQYLFLVFNTCARVQYLFLVFNTCARVQYLFPVFNTCARVQYLFLVFNTCARFQYLCSCSIFIPSVQYLCSCSIFIPSVQHLCSCSIRMTIDHENKRIKRKTHEIYNCHTSNSAEDTNGCTRHFIYSLSWCSHTISFINKVQCP